MVAILVDGEKLDELLVVGRFFEDLLLLIAACNDMIERTLELYSRLTRHVRTISEEEQAVKIAIFKSDPILSQHQGPLDIDISRNIIDITIPGGSKGMIGLKYGKNGAKDYKIHNGIVIAVIPMNSWY